MAQRAMADAITMMANGLAQETAARTTERVAQENLRGNEDDLRLERVLKNNPQAFNGGHNPDGAQKWLEGMEKIFGAMRCSETQKVTLGTYMLHEDANYWWKNASQRLGHGNAVITWEIFKREFLVKYFPADLRNRKVVEFMELKQGNLSVAEYAAKFEDLCRYSPHHNTVEAEEDKCVKFESGLCHDIKQLIGVLEIRNFATLVNKSNICDLDGKAKVNYYKAVNDKRTKGQDRGKPYDGKGKNKAGRSGEKGKNDGKCHKCGVFGHNFYECLSKGDKCYRCGNFGHKADSCKEKITCFNCGEEGHKSTMCKKPKKAGGKVFALSGEAADQVDNLIRGTRFICDTPLIAIIDTRATHSFISFGMNWLIFNRVHINCCEKTVVFPKLEEDPKLMSGKEVKESFSEGIL
ncbi:cleavage and polyadenylation specificity factor subunit [Trifolium repens]|nr:cleavage and polyadenylation specificity factor subunit [Trifolium repens]